MLTQRAGQRSACLQVAAHLTHNGRQSPVAGLLREHPQTRRQGQAGLDHRGELAREHRDIPRRHALPEP